MGDAPAFLGRLVAAAREAFPAPAELSVEPQGDSEERSEGVVLYVRMNEYADDVLERIDLAFERANGQGGPGPWQVVFTTDFQPPRGEPCPSTGESSLSWRKP
jgi:hypothetical protein